MLPSNPPVALACNRFVDCTQIPQRVLASDPPGCRHAPTQATAENTPKLLKVRTRMPDILPTLAGSSILERSRPVPEKILADADGIPPMMIQNRVVRLETDGKQILRRSSRTAAETKGHFQRWRVHADQYCPAGTKKSTRSKLATRLIPLLSMKGSVD